MGSRADVIIRRVAYWLYWAPVLAFLIAAILMVFVFDDFAQTGGYDPAMFTMKLSTPLWILIVGTGLGLVGWLLALVSFFRPYPEPRSGFWTWIILSVIYCFSGIKIVMVFGLILIGVILKKRKQFSSWQDQKLDVSDY